MLTGGSSGPEICALHFQAQTVPDVDILLISLVKKKSAVGSMSVFQQNLDNYQSAKCSEKMRVIRGSVMEDDRIAQLSP